MDEDHVDNRKEDDAGENSGENSPTGGENNADTQNKGTNVGLESIKVDNNGNKKQTVDGGNILGVDQSKNNFFCYTFVNKSDNGKVIRPKKFKKLDRKVRAHSISPQEKIRPKKRPRSGDPFGLNALLGIEESFSGLSDVGIETKSGEQQNEDDFLTPALNQQL
ncbi:hypothetical protein Hanom_Chr06g00512771 [Helianthus anomalus]